MIYLLLVTIALVIGFALYQLSFRKLTFFQWNRFYLIGIVSISLLIPIGVFIDLSLFFDRRETLPTIYFTDILDVEAITVTQNNQSLYLIDLILWIYWLGVVITAFFLCYKLFKLRLAFKESSSHSSFSFFRKIVLGSSIKDIKEINDHEKVHVEQGHSYDIVFMEFVTLFNWFNPIVYLIKKELKFQHECIADEICSTDKILYAELLLAHAMRTDVNLLQHEFSNQSFLKKRIMMLFKNKSTNNKKLFYLSVLPLLGILVLSTLVFNTSKAKEIVKVVEVGVEEVTLSNHKAANNDNQLNIVYDNEDKEKSITDSIYSTPEIMPQPKGGMIAFRRWIGKNYRFPKEAIDAGATGIIELSYVIEKDGSLADIKIVKDLGYGTGETAVRLLKKAAKWSPGIHNGKVVKTFFLLPIKLDLNIMSEDKQEAPPEYKQLDVSPEPPGGMATFRQWIANNYKYPKAAIDAEAKGKVIVSFIVEKDGSLSDIRYTRDVGYGTGEAAIELMREAPKWSPGIQNGKTIRVQYALPINIDLRIMEKEM